LSATIAMVLVNPRAFDRFSLRRVNKR